MNRRFAVLVICAVVAAGLVFLLNTRPKRATTESNSSSPSTQPSAKSAQAPFAATVTIEPPAAATPPKHSSVTTTTVARKTTPRELPSPDPDPSGLAPATVLENLHLAVRQYASQFGGNPVGTNPEITAALNGGNPKQVQFLKPEDGLRINKHGELVDSWGTPYFFHQLSGTEMEIHSAGPDRILWTADDLVIK